MTALSEQLAGTRWDAYYDRFPYFAKDLVRDGCHPVIMEHPRKVDKAIVLTHGLTDSPYFLNAIGSYFHFTLNYNVYLPLLHCHGLRDPAGMEAAELEEWKANVGFAIKGAAEKASHVSVGGLSTGGLLSLYMACTKPRVTGELYLFSAALDLAGGPGGLIGDIKERLLRSFLADILDSKKPLIGDNPFRYCRMDLDGARELARLIKETDELLDGFDARMPFGKRTFAAHSESDTTANINGIEQLQEKSREDNFSFFRIIKEAGVSHASVVLKDPIYAGGDTGNEILEKANPTFNDMMATVTEFERAETSGSA